jgi:hypothetical protein
MRRAAHPEPRREAPGRPRLAGRRPGSACTVRGVPPAVPPVQHQVVVADHVLVVRCIGLLQVIGRLAKQGRPHRAVNELQHVQDLQRQPSGTDRDIIINGTGRWAGQQELVEPQPGRVGVFCWGGGGHTAARLHHQLPSRRGSAHLGFSLDALLPVTDQLQSAHAHLVAHPVQPAGAAGGEPVGSCRRQGRRGLLGARRGTRAAGGVMGCE